MPLSVDASWFAYCWASLARLLSQFKGAIESSARAVVWLTKTLREILVCRRSPFWCSSRAADWSEFITMVEGRGIGRLKPCDGLLV
jgi:hypothetical protein